MRYVHTQYPHTNIHLIIYTHERLLVDYSQDVLVLEHGKDELTQLVIL